MYFVLSAFTSSPSFLLANYLPYDW